MLTDFDFFFLKEINTVKYAQKNMVLNLNELADHE